MEIWLVLGLLVMGVTPIVAVALSTGSLDRKGYSVRFIPTLLLFGIVELWFNVAYEVLPQLLLALLYLALQFLIVRWTAMRLNDLQSWRWYALTWYVWPFGLVLRVVLTVKRHRKDVVLF